MTIANRSFAQSFFRRAFQRPALQAALVVLLVLECLPIWTFQYFPSEDGPSHLYNASVLAHYRAEPLYQQYYRIAPTFAGNMLTDFILVFLLKLTQPLVAEKLLLSSYMVLSFISFRYLLRGLTPYADYFSLFAGVLFSNWFMYVGLWNFCFSVPLSLFTIGYYVRQQQASRSWTVRPLITLLICGVIVYMAHAVSWVVCVMAVTVFSLEPLVTDVIGRREERPLVAAPRRLLQHALPSCSLLGPAVPLFVYLAASHAKSTNTLARLPLRVRLWPVYSLSFLNTVAPSDPTWTKVVVAALFTTLLSVVTIVLWRRQYEWRSTKVLVLSLVCAVAAIFGPESIGTGTYIHVRVAFFGLLFLLAWLASALTSWPRWVLNTLAGVVWCITVLIVVSRLPVLSALNQSLSDFVLVGQSIRPRSTVLSLRVETNRAPIDVFRRAIGLLSSRSIIDLGNYEASPECDYFIMKFQADRSPFPALGMLSQLEAVPPVFDIGRYERETRGRVDYVLFYGATDSAGDESKSLEAGLYGHDRTGYTLVRSARSECVGTLRLYRRTAIQASTGRGFNYVNQND